MAVSPTSWAPAGGGLVAASVYAVFFGAVIAERTVLLEPLATFFCLIALLVMCRRVPCRAAAWYAAGALFGVAATVKAFALAAVVGVVVVLLGRRELAAVARLTAGFGITVLGLLVPFVGTNPAAFIHQVASTQLMRPAAGDIDRWIRLGDMLGLRGLGLAAAHSVSLAIALLLIVAITVAAQLRLVISRFGEPISMIALTALITIAAFTLCSSYYSHYAASLAWPLAITTGYLIARMTPQVRARSSMVVVGGLAVSCLVAVTPLTGWRPPTAQIAASIPRGACLATDSPTAAILADRFSFPRGCPPVIDRRGTALTLLSDRPEAFYPAGFRTIDRFQDSEQQSFRAADYALLATPPGTKPEWSAATATRFRSEFTEQLRLGGMSIWLRDRR